MRRLQLGEGAKPAGAGVLEGPARMMGLAPGLHIRTVNVTFTTREKRTVFA